VVVVAVSVFGHSAVYGLHKALSVSLDRRCVPSDTTRRRLVAVLATLPASCAARGGRRGAGADNRTEEPSESTETSGPTDTPTPAPLPERTVADPPDGPEPYPDRPERDTSDAAVAFARQFEYAQGYNLLHESDAETISVNAQARHVRAVAAGGHYVLGSRGGYANYADGVHADLGTTPRLYVVSPGYAVRVPRSEDRLRNCEEVDAADDASDNFAAECSGDDARYAVVNLAPETRELDVTVSRVETSETASRAGGGETVTDESYRLLPGRAVVFDGVTRRRGLYRLTVTAGDRETTAEWDLRNGPGERPPTVVSTPRRRLTVERFPDWPI
jgi:hypothetical protein